MHAKNNNNLSINHCEKANEMRFFNLLLEFVKLMFQLQCLFFRKWYVLSKYIFFITMKGFYLNFVNFIRKIS